MPPVKARERYILRSEGRRYIVHVAGPVEGQVQRCTRCDTILTDGRGHVMTPTPEAGGLHAWAVGARIGVSVGTNPTMYYVIDRDELDDDELPCRADA